jgi:hypothetical protein
MLVFMPEDDRAADVWWNIELRLCPQLFQLLPSIRQGSYARV